MARLHDLVSRIKIDRSAVGPGLAAADAQVRAFESASAARRASGLTAGLMQQRSAERAAQYESVALSAQLTKSKWAAEKIAADATYRSELQSLRAMEAQGQAIKAQSRQAELAHEVRMRELTRARLTEQSMQLKRIGAGMTIGVTAPIAFVGNAAIEADLRMDSMRRGLTSVMGSSAKTTAELERLKEVAKLPGLGFEEAIQGSLNLQAVGMSADLARETLMAFGNALATVGKGKNELAAVQEQIMQILSKGKVMTEDIRIIRSYVPQISQAMRGAFGTANAEEIGKMGVSAEEFIKRINEQLAKLPKMTSGLKNELENASDATTQALVDAGKAMEPIVIKFAQIETAAANAFRALPDSAQTAIVGFGAIAGAAGPAIYTIGILIGAKRTLKAASLLSKAANDLESISIVRNTGVEMTNASVKGTAAVTAGTLAAADTAVTGAVTIQTSVLARATIAWKAFWVAALAPVKAVLAALTAVAASAAAIPIAVGAVFGGALGLGIRHYEVKTSSAQDELDRNNRNVLENFKRIYSKHSTSQLERDLQRSIDERSEQIKLRRKYEGAGWMDPEGATEFREAQREYQIANQKVLWLKKQLESHKQVAATRGEVNKRKAEEAARALTENEKANRAALQEKYVLSQANEIEKGKAQAHVEWVNARQKALDAQKEALATAKIKLDIAPQLAAADYAYQQKLKEIASKAKDTALDELAANNAAKLNLMALQTQNEFESARLRENASHTETLRSLEKEKASQEKTSLAIAAYQKRINEINQQEYKAQAESYFSEFFAGKKSEALKAGDTFGLQKAGILEGFYSKAIDLISRQTQGENVANAMRYLWESTTKELQDASAAAAKEARDKLAEQNKTEWDTYFEGVGVWAENIELSDPSMAGKFKASTARFVAELEKNNRERQEAITKNTETGASKEQLANIDNLYTQNEFKLRSENRKNLLDIVTGGMDSFYSKLRERKDEEMRAWQERLSSAREYVKHLREANHFTTLQGVWEKAMNAGINAGVRMPYIPPPPSQEITQNDVASLLREIAINTNLQNQAIAAVTTAIGKLVPATF